MMAERTNADSILEEAVLDVENACGGRCCGVLVHDQMPEEQHEKDSANEYIDLKKSMKSLMTLNIALTAYEDNPLLEEQAEPIRFASCSLLARERQRSFERYSVLLYIIDMIFKIYKLK